MRSLSNRRRWQRGGRQLTNTEWRGRRGPIWPRRAAAVYRSDISYGSIPMRRGHWSDRLSAIDTDLAAMTERVKSAGQPDVSSENTRRATVEATGRPGRPVLACAHKPPMSFDAGAPLALAVTALVPDEVVSIRLHLPACGPGGTVEAGRDARGRRELYGCDSGRLHSNRIPAGVLLRSCWKKRSDAAGAGIQ